MENAAQTYKKLTSRATRPCGLCVFRVSCICTLFIYPRNARNARNIFFCLLFGVYFVILWLKITQVSEIKSGEISLILEIFIPS